MALSTPGFIGRICLLVVGWLLVMQAATAQFGPRYVFPNTDNGQLLALPNGEVLLASFAKGSPVLRLHWLNAQGDTIRSKRTRLRPPQPGTSYSVGSLLRNASGQILIGSSLLLTAQGDTIWTRSEAFGHMIEAPGGGWVSLSLQGTQLVKIDANGRAVMRVTIPTPTTVDWSVGDYLLPAVGGYWAIMFDADTTTVFAQRAVFVSETGVIGAQISLRGISQYIIRGFAALPNPADGYLALVGGGVQRFSSNWVPQWPSPVRFDGVGLDVAADGTSLLHYGNGPFVQTGFSSIVALRVAQVSSAGTMVQQAVIDSVNNHSVLGSDMAKSTTGNLLVQTLRFRAADGSYQLAVYTVAATLLAVQQSAAAPGLAVYPQPATEVVTIRTAGLRGQLTLLDGLGRVVRQLPVEAGKAEQQLPLQGLAAGIYVLRATDKGGQQLSTRISKQ